MSNNDSSPHQHQLIGSPISYYTGKARAYLRYKKIPFAEVLSSAEVYKELIIPRVGFPIIPVMVTDDDVTLQDTTDIIDDFERRYPEPAIYPNSPLQKLVALLLEVYGDEWLVIPAMHYRWNLPENRDYAIRKFGETSTPEATPQQQWEIGLDRSDRFSGMLPNLGITDNNTAAIERSYLNLLADLNAHFQQYHFLLGDRPSIGDYGLIGPLYAHLYLDPESGRIMKAQAPELVKWVLRTHNPQTFDGDFLEHDEIPETLMPILQRMASEHLPVLLSTVRHVDRWAKENSDEIKIPRRVGMHAFTVEGVTEERSIMPANQWMWQRAVDFYRRLGEADKAKVKQLFAGMPGMVAALEEAIPTRIKRENFRFVVDKSVER